MRTILRLPAPLGAFLLAVALASPAAGASLLSSSNWGGYVAHSSTTATGRFGSVSGSWTEPTAACTAGRETYSAVWVGLGGYRQSSKALEQIGTDADCSRAGHARYSAWVELVPAAATTLRLKVSPGDRLTASVSVSGHDTTLRLRDLTTGAAVSRTRRAARIDVSSAEWIVEAPSGCDRKGRCETLPLADFGQVGFSAASATSDGHTGLVEDSSWATTELLLRQDAAGPAVAAGPERGTLLTATPSATAAGTFTVTYGEQAGEAVAGTALPGASGGGTPP